MKNYCEPQAVLRSKDLSPITCLKYFNTNKEPLLFTGNAIGNIIIWSKKFRRPVEFLNKSHKRSVITLCALGDSVSDGFISHGRDGMVCEWKGDQHFKVINKLKCTDKGFCAVVVIPGTRILAMPTDVSSQVALIDIDSKEVLMTLSPKDKAGSVFSIQFLDNGYIVIAYENGCIMSWDVRMCRNVPFCEYRSPEIKLDTPMTTRDASTTIQTSVDLASSAGSVDSHNAYPTESGQTIAASLPSSTLKLFDDPVFACNFWGSSVLCSPLHKPSSPLHTTSPTSSPLHTTPPTSSPPCATSLPPYTTPTTSLPPCATPPTSLPPYTTPTPPPALYFGCAGSADCHLSSLTLRRCDAVSTLVGRRRLSNDGVSCLCYRLDGRLLASGGWDGRIRIFSAAKLKPLAVLDLHSKTVNCLTFDARDHLTAGSADGMISIWDLYAD